MKPGFLTMVAYLLFWISAPGQNWQKVTGPAENGIITLVPENACSFPGFLPISEIHGVHSISDNLQTFLCLPFPDSVSQISCVTTASGNISGLQGFWAGTLQQGIFGISASGIFHFHSANSPLPDNHIRRIEERGDTLWIATAGGLARFTNNQWKIWDISQGLASAHITDFCFLPNGMLAIASVNGGLAYLAGDTVNSVLTTFNAWLPDNTITALCTDLSGTLWLAFANAGLAAVQDTVINFYNPQQTGFPASGIRHISPISFPFHGLLVATESSGIVCFRPGHLLLHWQAPQTPFSNDEIQMVRGASANFPFHLAAGPNGLYVFNPNIFITEENAEHFPFPTFLTNPTFPSINGLLEIYSIDGRLLMKACIKQEEPLYRPGDSGWFILKFNNNYRKIHW